MIIIAHADDKFGIGKNGGLLARLPEDMKFFKETTTGNIVVMGSSTYKSLPKRPLPDRVNIVLTSKPEQFPEVRCVETIGDILQYSAVTKKEIYICGGGSVYLQLLPYCEKALITRVEGDLGADVFMPDLDNAADWELIEESEPQKSGEHMIKFTTYVNKAVRGIDSALPELD